MQRSAIFALFMSLALVGCASAASGRRLLQETPQCGAASVQLGTSSAVPLAADCQRLIDFITGRGQDGQQCTQTNTGASGAGQCTQMAEVGTCGAYVCGSTGSEAPCGSVASDLQSVLNKCSSSGFVEGNVESSANSFLTVGFAHS